MEFIKKNYVTMLVVGATVVLAGVAIFTALRLYQLREDGITPNEPEITSADEAPVSVTPSSNNWDLPDLYIITNVSDEDLDVAWMLDCWDETVCEDSSGEETLSPGESFEQGLGVLCSQWQLSINYSGTATADGDVWDWAESSQIDPACDVELDFSDPDATDEAELDLLETTQDVSDTDVTEAMENDLAADFGDFAVTQCTDVLAFSIGEVVTQTPTPVASVSPTPAPSVAPSTVASSTPTPIPSQTPELPDAGVGLPTVIGLGAGAILLIIAMTLAI